MIIPVQDLSVTSSNYVITSPTLTHQHTVFSSLTLCTVAVLITCVATANSRIRCSSSADGDQINGRL